MSITLRRTFFDASTFLTAFMIGIAFNTIVSSRGNMIWFILKPVFLSYYLRDQRFKPGTILAGIGIMLIGFNLMSSFRVRSAGEETSPLKVIEPIVVATNLIDISKTAHIMAAVPEQLDFAMGQTYASIFIAWIPREIWTSKPIANADNIIGMEVYGARVFGSGGVPPGLIAELFWNFWYPGTLIGCFLAGYLMKVLDTYFFSRAMTRNKAVVYVGPFLAFGMSLLGSSFTSLIVGVLMSFIPLYIILRWITSSSPQRTGSSGEARAEYQKA